ncbi:hypothetical protein R5R73_04965 [Salinicola sp. LHM]|uniref:hypothetical protein n=1 Tax=Salinicola sp. LHM TaxID=3065298 RepID=UPI002ACE0EE9|nr:hypothetical protein [Salinicola sp. LHM]WQH34040.1 hypothetical protein R5R73_04965 [Salinicola sp. LHM]
MDNVHDRAALTVTSAAPECAIDNTQRNEREYLWRSADLAPQTVGATLPELQFLDAVVLIGHNLSGAATVTLRVLVDGDVVATVDDISTAEYVPAGVWRAGIDPFGASYNDQLSQPLTIIDVPTIPCTGYELTIDDPDNADGAIEVQRIVAGLGFVSEYGPSWGVDLNWVDPGQQQRSAGRTLRTIGGGQPWRELTVSLDNLTPEDRSRLLIELAQRGIVGDVFVDCYPNRAGPDRLTGAFLARLKGGWGDTHNRLSNYQSKPTFVEV